MKTPTAFSDFDRQVFEWLVPKDHFLRQVEARSDFERSRPLLNEAYKPQMGRPPVDVVRLLKIEFLRFHYRLSDRQAMERIRTDAAFRWFLGLTVQQAPPRPRHRRLLSSADRRRTLREGVFRNSSRWGDKRVHDKAATPEYAQTRAVHPRIERKLGELARHHGCRRARYRGLGKFRIQAFMTALVVNAKRIVKLLGRKILAEAALPVRGELQGAWAERRKPRSKRPFSGCRPGLGDEMRF